MLGKRNALAKERLRRPATVGEALAALGDLKVLANQSRVLLEVAPSEARNPQMFQRNKNGALGIEKILLQKLERISGCQEYWPWEMWEEERPEELSPSFKHLPFEAWFPHYEDFQFDLQYVGESLRLAIILTWHVDSIAEAAEEAFEITDFPQAELHKIPDSAIEKILQSSRRPIRYLLDAINVVNRNTGNYFWDGICACGGGCGCGITWDIRTIREVESHLPSARAIGRRLSSLTKWIARDPKRKVMQIVDYILSKQKEGKKTCIKNHGHSWMFIQGRTTMQVKHLKLENEPDVLGILILREGQYEFISREDAGKETRKFLSEGQVAMAFAKESVVDSDWLPGNILRTGHSMQDSFTIGWFGRRRHTCGIMQESVKIEPLTIPLPSIVFAGRGRTYYIWAAKGSRFDPAGAPFHAPFPNVYPNGSICWGSNKPPECTPQTIEAAFRMFLSSPFSNHLLTGKSRSEEKDVRMVLRSLANHRLYPGKDLVPLRRSSSFQGLIDKWVKGTND